MEPAGLPLSRRSKSHVTSIIERQFWNHEMVLLSLLAFMLCSCTGSSQANHAYDDVRVIQEAVHPILPGATHAQRFGSVRPRGSTPEPAMAPALAYDLPDGWVDAPLTEMRRVNVLIAGHPDGECYLIVIPGGGSLRQNIDRWCQQMGQEPISDDAVHSLPPVAILGAEGVRFEIDGTFTDGFSGKVVSDARMIVHVLPIGDSTLFVKAIGPRTLLQSEAENLARFVTSLRLERNSQPQQPPPSSLRWSTPEGWTVDGPRPMREVTFLVGEETSCWITVLGGDAGGALANANRWLAELSLEPIGPEQLSTLSTEQMLGGEAIVIDGTGPYSSMGSPPKSDWGMIGLIRQLGDRSVFVKMVGPAADVAAARESMMQLVSSLEILQ